MSTKTVNLEIDMKITPENEFYLSFVHERCRSDILFRALLLRISPGELATLEDRLDKWTKKDFQRVLDAGEEVKPTFSAT